MLRHLPLVLLLAAGAAQADIDLTPVFASNQFGGFTAARAQFKDGDKKIAVSLDSDAKVSATEGGAVFRFDNIPQATVLMRRSPLEATVAFDAEGLVRYRKAALGMLPAMAEAITEIEAVANPESINDGHSFRFTFTYKIAQAEVRDSIIFLNIDTRQQIVVQTGAYAKDHEAAWARTSRMIRDWHVLTPAEEKGEN